jgi:hypothetical protein
MEYQDKTAARLRGLTPCDTPTCPREAAIGGDLCDACRSLQHIATEGDNINPVLVWSDLAPKERYTLRAIFTDMDAAHAFMAENRDTGLLAEFGPFLLVANLKANKAVRRG